MTFKALVPGPPQLGAMTARPYRVPLSSDASPAAVIAQLSEDDHPGALWGDWFDGGLLIFRLPLRVAEPVNATDGFDCLDDQPLVVESELRSGLVGGGWLACLGYDPGTTALAFYDSSLRWLPRERVVLRVLGAHRAGTGRCGSSGVLERRTESRAVRTDRAGAGRGLRRLDG